MCLAIPGKIVEIDQFNLAQIDVMGALRQASLDLVPQAKLGDYVLVHAGFAIEVIDEQSVAETLKLIEELAQVQGIDLYEDAEGGQGEPASSFSTQTAASTTPAQL